MSRRSNAIHRLRLPVTLAAGLVSFHSSPLGDVSGFSDLADADAFGLAAGSKRYRSGPAATYQRHLKVLSDIPEEPENAAAPPRQAKPQVAPRTKFFFGTTDATDEASMKPLLKRGATGVNPIPKPPRDPKMVALYAAAQAAKEEATTPEGFVLVPKSDDVMDQDFVLVPKPEQGVVEEPVPIFEVTDAKLPLKCHKANCSAACDECDAGCDAPRPESFGACLKRKVRSGFRTIGRCITAGPRKVINYIRKKRTERRHKAFLDALDKEFPS